MQRTMAAKILVAMYDSYITNLIYDNAVRVATAQICVLYVICVMDWMEKNIVCA